jgi:hypothetical protein
MTADEPWQGSKREWAWDLEKDPKPSFFAHLDPSSSDLIFQDFR